MVTTTPLSPPLAGAATVATSTRRGWARWVGPAPRRRAALAGYVFVLPGFALYTLVMLYPALRAALMSVQDVSIVPGRPSPFVGLEHYLRAVEDPVVLRSFVNAAVYMAVTVPAQMAIGLALAVLLDARLPGRTLFRVLFYLPVITSWVIVSLLFQWLFATDLGIVNWFLVDATGLLDEKVNWLGGRWTGMAAISTLGIWKGVGFSMIVYLAALTGVPRELHEAAALDGAGAWRRFRFISLPFIRGTSVMIAILLVIGGFNVFISVLLMTGGGPLDQTQVPLTYMYRQAFEFLEFGYGSAISFLLTLVVLALAALQYAVTRRRVAEVDQ